MKRLTGPAWRQAVVVLTAVFTPFLFAACSDSPSGNDGTEGNPPEASINLSQQWGGLTDTDEAPNFGEPEIEGLNTLQSVTEPLSTDPRVQTLEADPDREVVFLRVIWGNLARNAPESTATGSAIIWDGSLQTSSGALLVQNLIAFEGLDHIVRPRTDPRILPFVSKTYGGVDGILVRLVMNPDSVDAEDVLTFNTPPLNVSFPLQGIATLDSVIPVDDRGNGVALTAVTDDRRDPCAHGLVNGVWRRSFEEGDGGYFRGLWVTPNGFIAGAMRGRFGLTPDGHPIVLGKVITPNGHFLGFIRGTFTVEDTGDQGDWHAFWFGRDRLEPIGRLGGHWVARESGDRGLLHGRWGRFCEEQQVP